jgi:hypothetical protein
MILNSQDSNNSLCCWWRNRHTWGLNLCSKPHKHAQLHLHPNSAPIPYDLLSPSLYAATNISSHLPNKHHEVNYFCPLLPCEGRRGFFGQFGCCAGQFAVWDDIDYSLWHYLESLICQDSELWKGYFNHCSSYVAILHRNYYVSLGRKGKTTVVSEKKKIHTEMPMHDIRMSTHILFSRHYRLPVCIEETVW